MNLFLIVDLLFGANDDNFRFLLETMNRMWGNVNVKPVNVIRL